MHMKAMFTFAAASFALAGIPGLSFAQTIAQATFVSFDAPDGGRLIGAQVGINIQGTIATTYTDGTGTHTLIRESNELSGR